MLISAEAMPFELFEHIKSSAESSAARMVGRRDFCRDPDEVRQRGGRGEEEGQDLLQRGTLRPYLVIQ